MPQKNKNVHALTHASKGITNRIESPVEITNVLTNQIISTKGIWDTGATGSSITKSTASLLGLCSIGRRKVRGVHGINEVNVYYVRITLNNKNITIKARVTECNELSADNTVGMLIGMNVITMGDFAITNYKGDTIMSFRVPSLQKIDFVSGLKTVQQIVKN